MSSSDDVNRVLAVVSDLKHTTKKLEALHELDVKMAIEFFERSPPLRKSKEGRSKVAALGEQVVDPDARRLVTDRAMRCPK